MEQMSRSPDPGIDQTDLFTQEDIRIDRPVHIKVLAQGQPEWVFKGMNGLRDFHQISPPLMALRILSRVAGVPEEYKESSG
jgi:hypothetical protein